MRLDEFRAALVAVDEAVTNCLRVAWEMHHSEADAAVDAYQRADARADLLLSAIIADGGTPGLLDATEAAVRRANERTVAIFALRAGGADERGAAKALQVAEHAEDRAAARDLRVRREVLLPWAARRVRRTEEAA